ncbi:hypothetical protein [Maliponia aquimaris]|jgi:hypothetical protein|uniref:Uncharacterized protein n=1 Tax=Maliponia aquimaris TaxID=1673631 RepID=A0A238L277_9RHOB|nr:hypothetical protein [Maliponia aquimaris]SMX49109.1 hypothetical protein MAA8898_04189 [Maliponia aquimaris]
MALFDLTRWPALLVFALAGAVATCFAFVSVNLFVQAMAGAAFLQRHGWTAVRYGALYQVAELAFWGALALACWLVFKVCEAELTDRYRRWCARRRGPDQDGR